MRPRALALSTLLFLLATGLAGAADIRTGHDPEFDFSRIKTYAWSEGIEKAAYPGLDRRIRAEADKGLAAKGLRKLAPGEGDPDVLLHYNVGAADMLIADARVTVGWYGDLIAVPGGRSTVSAGLLLEMRHPETDKSLWAAAYIMRGNTPDALQVMVDRAERAVRGALKRYPPK